MIDILTTEIKGYNMKIFVFFISSAANLYIYIYLIFLHGKNFTLFEGIIFYPHDFCQD